MKDAGSGEAGYAGVLTRYLASATLARGADSGAAVGLVLLATTTPHVARPGLIGGLLVSCLTAPHLAGPVLGRRLDRARDARVLLAAICTVYAATLAIATVAIGSLPIVVVALLVAAAGLCGPLLTGGLSSRLGLMVAGDDHAQRRAQGWDSLSYSVGGTAGPAAVAALAGIFGARWAMLLLAAAALAAALLMLTLPRDGGEQVPSDKVLPVRQTLRLIATTGPLRRVMYATMVTSVPGGAIAVLAVALGRNLHVSPENGALLAAAFGFGGLLGSLAVIARPLLGEPEKLVTATMALVGAGFAFCALAPSYTLAVVAFALVGALNSPMFAATLASRATYSPPQARAQVFVSMAALKVAASSLGTAAVGVAIGIGARPLLGIGAAAILVTAAATIIERRVTEPRNGAPTDGSAEAAGVTGGQATAVPRAPGTPRG